MLHCGTSHNSLPKVVDFTHRMVLPDPLETPVGLSDLRGQLSPPAYLGTVHMSHHGNQTLSLEEIRSMAKP